MHTRIFKKIRENLTQNGDKRYRVVVQMVLTFEQNIYNNDQKWYKA